MILNEIIATTVDEVGLSWFDFFSIGHITFGIAVFLIFSLFYTVPVVSKDEDYIMPPWLVFVLTIVVLVVWEFLENILMFAWGMKFEGRQDSWQNITTDILLGVVGALCSWGFAALIIKKDKNIWDYYIFGIVSFAIWLIFFFIFRELTLYNIY